MRRKGLSGIAVRIVVLVLLLSPLARGQQIEGLWDGTVLVDGVLIPFQLEVAQTGSEVNGAFLDGERRVTSTNGRIGNGSLVLEFDHYAEKLQASVHDATLEGAIEGRFGPGPRSVLPFRAQRIDPPSLSNWGNPYVALLQTVDLSRREYVASQQESHARFIGGLWEIPVKSSKGESAWRFIVRTAGSEVSAAILRVDGDTGTLTGRYEDRKFVLSHFAGERPYLLEVTPAKDGTLQLILHDHTGWRELTAYRPAEARRKGLPEPDDPSHHTTVRDRNEVFHFRFSDVHGQTVSNTDPRFRGKVVLVSITGSWCPNCHDEAPFLAELYREYRGRGLEVVALDFEEADQLKDLSRLRAFIEHYGVEYPVLVAGEPSQLNEKITQVVNLNAWPTTSLLGRDGLVRSIHAGFASPASGEFHRAVEFELRAQVESLLGERVEASR